MRGKLQLSSKEKLSEAGQTAPRRYHLSDGTRRHGPTLCAPCDTGISSSSLPDRSFLSPEPGWNPSPRRGLSTVSRGRQCCSAWSASPIRFPYFSSRRWAGTLRTAGTATELSSSRRSASMVLALTLAWLTLSHRIQIWELVRAGFAAGYRERVRCSGAAILPGGDGGSRRHDQRRSP